MGIHEDVRTGALTKDSLEGYLKSEPNIIDQADSAEGLTPLAAAVVRGYADQVDLLLKNGAKVDFRSSDDETLLLLAASKTPNDRSRIIQLLLGKTPRNLIDVTCPAVGNKTPLMLVVVKKDLESIRLLRFAGASSSVKNEAGDSAESLAQDKAVKLALNPDEKSYLRKLADIVVSILGSILAFVNRAHAEIIKLLYGLDPPTNDDIEKPLMGSDKPSEAQFVAKIDKFVADNSVLERFFKDDKDYIRKVARNAMELKNDTSTPLGGQKLLSKTIKVSLHRQVIYCDDSSSMRLEDGKRWKSQKQLAERIARITTRILPEGEGVELRFINNDTDGASNLTLKGIERVLDGTSWASNGNTEIGKYLRLRILEPLVYSKLVDRSLDRPLLVSVITDGRPSKVDGTKFVDEIVKCGAALEEAGYPRETVKFLVGQVGGAEAAKNFLESLRANTDISKTAYCTTGRLDEKFADFRDNEWRLDEWLIKTLFLPIKDGVRPNNDDNTENEEDEEDE